MGSVLNNHARLGERRHLERRRLPTSTVTTTTLLLTLHHFHHQSDDDLHHHHLNISHLRGHVQCTHISAHHLENCLG